MKSMQDAYDKAAQNRVVSLIATAADKADAPAFRALAGALRLPVRGIAPDQLAGAETMTNAMASLVARGTGSVAEAAALVAAGPGASLLGVRVVSWDRMATCALAEGVGL